MVTARGGALEAHETDEQVSENVGVLLRRRRMTQGALGAAVGISPQTISRRIAGTQPWQWWEVVEIARFFDVSLEELSGELPSRAEYAARPSQYAIRDSNPEPAVLRLAPNRRRREQGETPYLRAVV